MDSRTLTIMIEAKNNADKALKGLGLNLQEAEKASKAVALGLLGATTAVVAFGIKAVASAQEVELAQNQLEHAILAVSGGTQEQVVQVNKLIDSLERKGVIDGDNLKIGVAQLSTFGLTTKMVQDLIPAVADLTVNQFGISASGDQFAQSANMIAKALKGQFGVLEKSGIRFTEAQQNMIKFGTESERSSALLEGFNQNLKLTNETARQTSAGAMQALKVSFGNITEGIGAQLLPILASLMEKLNVFASETLPAVVERTQEIIQWFDQHRIALAVLAGAIIGALIPAFVAMATTLITITIPALVASAVALAPFIAIGALVAGVIYGIYYAIKNWETIKDFAVAIWDIITAKLTEFWNWVVSSLATFTEPIIAGFQAFWDGITLVFDIALAVLIGSIELFFNLFGTDTNTVLEYLKGLFTAFWNAVKGTFTIQMEALKLVWKLWWDANKLAVDVGTKAITGLAKAMWDALLLIWNGIKTGLSALWDAMWNAMGERVKSAWNGIVSSIKTSINAIVDMINRILQAINEAKNKVKGVGAIVPDIPLIPRLAKGGIVNKPTIAMIGEAGAEAVVPLSRGGMAGAGLGNIVFNITGNTFLDEESAEKMGDLIIKRFKLNNAI